ncbi:MAG: ABC transporter permease [Terriglobales bacterium]
MLHDLRFALRMMRRAPGFTAVAVMVLALGIGANTAIFSLVDSILLKPLPFPHPEQLVEMHETEQSPGAFPLSGPDFPDWKAQSRLFADMTLMGYPRSLNLSGTGLPERIIGMPVEANYFSLLGVPAALGRTFAADESQAGKDQVVVLSHNLWESHFGGDLAVLGRSITLDGQSYTIIGVAPAAFRLQPTLGLWTAMDMNPKSLGERGNHSYQALGRMKPGVTLAQAQAEMSAIAAGLTRTYPNSNNDTGAKLFLLRDRLVLPSTQASVVTLIEVVGLVLLIACANLANLLLARALGRQKEISIRLALGARRSHIVRQLLTESVLLALIGAGLGWLFAWLAVRAVISLPAFPLPQFNPITLNGAVLGFTAALAVACGILFGLAPALRLSRPRLAEELSGAGALAGSGHRRWLGDGLMVAEIALSVVLVAAAALFIQSYNRLRSSALGFAPGHLLTASINLPQTSYPGFAQSAQFQRSLLERVRALPGVRSAALASELPLEGGSNGYIVLPGETKQRSRLVEWTRISSNYFETMRIPLVMGSGYTAADLDAWNSAAAIMTSPGDSAASLARFKLGVVVNQTMARHFYPGQNPIGKQFKTWGAWLTIKGVARDVPIFSLAPDDMAQAYFPIVAMDNSSHLVLRTTLPQAQVAAGIRGALAGLDAALPLYNIRTMDQVADQSVRGQAFQQWMIAAFAALALLLAGAGLYGVMAYLVAARTREIGVRMALGASRAAVLRLVAGRGLRLAALGIALGLAGALAAGRLFASQLYHVRPTSPAALAGAALVLLAACLLACYFPARRAASVDPNTALRVT